MSMRTEKKWYTVCSADALPLREGRRVVYGDTEVALFNIDGEFLAVENRCPHKGGPLADGIVSGKNVFCPLHNWKIDLTTGQVVAGGEGSVRTCPLRATDGKIQISL